MQATTPPPTASLSRLQTFYNGFSPEALLNVMITQEFAGRIALLSSFGADSALLIEMVAAVDRDTPVFFLETGKHFPQTLDYVETLRDRYALRNLIVLTPQEEMLSRIDQDGLLWKAQPNRCCWLRKVEPLNRALAEGGYLALITGRKRYQTENRQEMDPIEMGEDGIFRINPLWGHTRESLDEATRALNLPQHPLVAQGYLSIGCAPCTAPVTAGQQERAGRWQHTERFPGAQKSECGIHVPNAAEAVQGWEI